MGSKILWRPTQRKHDNGKATGSSTAATKTATQVRADEELEFHRIRNLRRIDEILKDQQQHAHNNNGDPPSLIITTPPQRPLIEIINERLVVGQEVALTVILLAVHREIVIQESEEYLQDQQSDYNNGGLYYYYLTHKPSLAMITLYATLIIIVYYNRQSSARDQQRQQRRKRAIVRLSDGLLLAAMLRFLSGLMRTLTASYSTDTVYTLAINGMVIHLLACDYRYANGESSMDIVQGVPSNTSSSSQVHPRPPFFGGAVSLNAAFFSTVLLVSRIKSNATSYAFVSSVVTLFAFYPASRHNIAGSYPNTIRGSPCFIITFALSIAAWLLLSSWEKLAFASVQMLIFVMSPCLQWRLQRHKKIVTGPWDIAHIHVPA